MKIQIVKSLQRQHTWQPSHYSVKHPAFKILQLEQNKYTDTMLTKTVQSNEHH
jgi:hypothetical protein